MLIAIELIAEFGNFIEEMPDLEYVFYCIEVYRIKIYIFQKNWDYARLVAERFWYRFEIRTDKVFRFLTTISAKQGDWETMEDACMSVYAENKHSPYRISTLFFAHLKRKSYKKAEYIYTQTRDVYPAYMHYLEEILDQLKIEPEVFLNKTKEKDIEDGGIYSDVKELISNKASDYLNSDKIEEIFEAISDIFYNELKK